MQQTKKLLGLLRKVSASGLILALLALNSPMQAIAANLGIGVDTLGDSAITALSTHSIAFTTETNLYTGDRIELYFPDFVMNLTSSADISVTTGPAATATYSNTNKKNTLTLDEDFTAGNVVVEIAADKITNPSTEGEYSVSILTRDASNNYAVLDSGIATVGVANALDIKTTVNSEESETPTGGGSSDSDTPPTLNSITIVDTAGITSDTTPPIKISAGFSPNFIALSCNAGANWSSWISYPSDDELNTSNDKDFDITTSNGCNTENGLKTIMAKLKNNSGYESVWVSDSTIFENETTTTETAPSKTTETPIATPEELTTQSIPLAATITTTNTRLIEVGYTNTNKLWKSISDAVVDTVKKTVTATAPTNTTLETRVINAKILDNYTSTQPLNTNQPILVNESGKTSVAVEMNSPEIGATALIPTATTITNQATGEIYNRIIYPAETVTNPPTGSGDTTITNAFFIGSSSTNLSFDKPVELTLPAGENPINPKIFYYNEILGDWVLAEDTVTKELGGKMADDKKTISIAVDHMTIFSVVDVSEESFLVFLKKFIDSEGIETQPSTQITFLTAGPDFTQRNSWYSGKWVSPADVGNDDTVSFVWNAAGESFAYELDFNSKPDSITEDSPTTTENAVDNFKLEEGSNYFHFQSIDAAGKRSSEKVFTLNYDKTPPALLSAEIEIPEAGIKIGDTVDFTLHFSEPITTPDILTVYFSFGGVVEIPKLTTPVDFVSGNFVLKNSNENLKEALVTAVGMLVDRAGLTAINPVPVGDGVKLSDGGIYNPRLIMKKPSASTGGKYFTTEDAIQVIPTAEGSTEMWIRSENLVTTAAVKFDEWIPYSQKELDLQLASGLGAKKITMDFRNPNSSNHSAGVIITRLPANSAELAASEKVWEGLAKIMRNQTNVGLEELITQGLSEDYRDLAENNPNFNPSILQKVSIENLNTALKIVTEIKEIIAAKDIEITLLTDALSRLNSLGCKLTDFFTPEEINQLFTDLSVTELAEVRKYIDLNTTTLQKNTAGKFNISRQSLGLRDSDGDGLSDKTELLLGTNPYSADSDLDGWSDGAEVLDFGSNPLSADKQMLAGFSNLKAGSLITDPRPILHGGAMPNEKLTLTAINTSKETITLGNTTADASGKWLLIPEISLSGGKYTFRLSDTTSGKILSAVAVEINLDFIMLPPQLYVDSDSLSFTDTQPEFYGNTFYGNTIVATFQSEISSTAVIADNAAGDFVIRPPENLGVGKHTLIVYTELPEGLRSPARVISFEIKGKQTTEKTFLHLPSTEDTVIGGIVIVGIFGAFFFLSRRRKVRV
ncbi:MAG: thrombospondin type 3 repeat-containing protein [Candidatus Gracilibacteria bacterium]|nr:thrombospondin type 3 repeat-containing protein [Candidatus Gracilibacteria bacterium]MDD5178683.1 thrombospondin type 3 repeat-containing protein [Candidatus Gracilibacteria bacterium]